MLDKKKRNFLILVFIFASITMIKLTYDWQFNSNSSESMMTDSMGNMMSSMHLQNITMEDLIRQQEQMDNTMTVNDEHSNHHSGGNGFMTAIHKLTTGTIVILLPFIIAGTIFLTIVWFKKSKPGGLK